MANYNQVSYGSSDKETVTELQKLLNSKGNYGLEVDGIFGDQTKNAVLDFQKQSGLAEDGIVGNDTWGALTKVETPADPAAPAGTDTENAAGFVYEPYQKSDTVAQAEALLQQQLAQKPGAYVSPWQDQLNDTIDKILNRDKFSYDLNADALYRQYRDNYIRQGQMAMMDTVGQASALTGGYGNSYAQNVGQQAYEGYLQNLNDVVPELYQLALDQYDREGQALLDRYGILGAREEQDYGRYQDQLSDYYAGLDRLTEDARYQGEQDYGKWADERDFAYGQYADDRAYAYQREQDELAKQEAAAQLMASAGDYSLLGQLYGLTEEQTAKLNGKTGSAGNKEKGDSSSLVKQAQAKVGASVTGVWDAESAARAKKLGYNSLEDVIAAYGLVETKQLAEPATLRELAIADWAANMLANTGGDPARIVASTDFLTSDKEREYVMKEILPLYGYRG